jgi:2-C-methyl-D-erythritol 4-phosphate cytidylyltransferase
VGGLLALPLADTLKEALPDSTSARVGATVSRAGKWAAQTPQMFRIGLLRPALVSALSDHEASASITDEASAIERLGHAPLLVPGAYENFKVTWPGDFALAERLLRLA